MPKEKVDFKKNPTETESQGGDIEKLIEKEEPLEVRVGQLEVKIDALKERVDGTLESRKWILIAILTIMGLAIAAGTFIFNIVRDSQNSYRDLQNIYYKELIEIHKNLEQSQIEQHNESIPKTP